MKLCLLALYFAIFGASTLAAPTPAPAQTYRVALRYLPARLDPWGDTVSTNQLILLNVYYPLLTRSGDGKLQSAFLEVSKSRFLTNDFKQYVLCLKDDVRFSDGSPIQVSELKDALENINKVQDPLPRLGELKEEGRCVRITLQSGDAGFLDKLTGVTGTLLKSGTAGAAVPIGLGPYRVAEIAKERLKLEANPGRVQGVFKSLEFVKFSGLEQAEMQGVDDLNHVYQLKLPASLKASLQRVPRPTVKSYALVVNHPDAKLRKAFHDCFDRRAFRELTGLDLLDIPGFVPRGLLGAEIKPMGALAPRNPSECQPEPSGGPGIEYLNYSDEQLPAVQKFFAERKGQLPLQVTVKRVTPEELVTALFSRDKVLGIVGFDGSGGQGRSLTDASMFYESFTKPERKERVISEPVLEVRRLVELASSEKNPQAREAGFRKAHEALLKSSYLIPLGQLDTAQYYPRRISSIQWIDRISGFPRIDLMQVR